VFAASDTQAMGVLQAAEECGRRVPDDVSVIGFDDVESAALLKLSTVRQPLEESGEVGARRLCALLAGETKVPMRTVLPLEVVARASTGRLSCRQRPPPHTKAARSRPQPPGVK
jgi:LacI family transcriptional regulator/LacI family repressor for deo operon, udp, cdd, tsx, nupC, and nupG